MSETGAAETGGETKSGEEAIAESKIAELGPAVAMIGLFTLTILGGLALLGPFRAENLQAFENPSSLSNTGLIVVEVLVFTAIFLVAFRYELGEKLMKGLVILLVAYFLHTPVRVLAGSSALGTALSVGIPALVALTLFVYPEWFVLDAVGMAFGAAAIALFSISLTPLPVLSLLVVMAVYDAYSVYVSEHMQSLGSGIVDLKLPMVYIVPSNPLEFSIMDTEDLEELGSQAMLLGLGDALFPGLLAGSAAVFLDAPAVVAGLNAPALGALVGAVVGMIGLEYLLFTVRRTHAGLPVLNGAVIAGYVLGAQAAGIGLVTALGLGPYV